jgi:hypothetical protein
MRQRADPDKRDKLETYAASLASHLKYTELGVIKASIGYTMA